MNILIFGPNGSGKGTRAHRSKKYGIQHVESGVIFRENIKKKTPRDEGQGIHRPRKPRSRRNHHSHDLDRLKETTARGMAPRWIPRNFDQAKALDASMREVDVSLDYVIEIVLDRTRQRSA